ncbi:uncharacterized protein LOC119975422 isoform X2 [Scyliorhinus canicula]|uniref:uncharacterized protein LOC119975422 isoform X2 n=1 Tax=Scyliorhinus canicula TaxID=7830 RepID=UPI0018F4BDF7|nr:uncharacterized protein LOC119975422 isoform X2 [Scyliorhinus canicula]
MMHHLSIHTASGCNSLAKRKTLNSLAASEGGTCRTSGWDTFQELCSQAAKRYLITLHRYQKRQSTSASAGVPVQAKGYTSKRYTPLSKREPKFGAAARTMCIGMCYAKAEQLNDLLQVSIECGRMTHSYPAGFLGTFCTALFASYAIQGKPIVQWGRKMMEVMPIAEQYCERKMTHFSDYRENWFSFETKWQFYLQLRGIEKDGCDSAMFPRIYDIEEQNKLYRRWRSEASGMSKGVETTLIAYDALLFAGKDWKKLCYSAMFHWGESDATGAIAGSLYGILYGFDNIPMSLYQNLEFRGHLEQLGRQLYEVASTDRPLCLSADHTQGDKSIDVHPVARTFVCKRTTDEINNLINYIAQLEKVKNANTKKSVDLTNELTTAQVGTKAKSPETEGKPRPTKFQLLQSRFTKIGLQSKLEKLQPPEQKEKNVSEQCNTAAVPQSTGVNFSTVDKQEATFTEGLSPTSSMVKQKCEPIDSKMDDSVLEKPRAESDITTLCHTPAQTHGLNPKFPTIDNRHTGLQQAIDSIIQQFPVGKKIDAAVGQSGAENGTTSLRPNTLQKVAKQTFHTDKANDTCSETASEVDMHIQLGSQTKNKGITLDEPVVQMVTEMLYPATEFQASYQINNLAESSRTSNDVGKNDVKNVNFAENVNKTFPLGETVGDSPLCLSKVSPSDINNIHENKFQTPKYIPEGSTPVIGDTRIIGLPQIITNEGLPECTEDSLFMTNNTEENPTQTGKENTEKTTKSPRKSPELLSDTCEMQTLKEILQKSVPALTTETVTLPNNELHRIKQREEQNKYTLHQSDDLIIAAVQHGVKPREQPLQISKENVEKSITQTKSSKPSVNLCEKQTLKEIAQKSEPATPPKIPKHTKEGDYCQNNYNLNHSGELVIATNQLTVMLQEQPQQIQKGNTEANSQTRSSQPFTGSCDKQKLEKSSQKSELAISTKIHILPENQLQENEYSPYKLSDSVNSDGQPTVVQEERRQETPEEVAAATKISQTQGPGSYKKKELEEIPQKLQPSITAKILPPPCDELFEVKDDYQHSDMFNQSKHSDNVAKCGTLEEHPPGVDQVAKTETAPSTLNKCPGNTAFNKSKPWKYKAYSYADPSVVSKSNRRVLMRATDVMQFSSAPTSFDSC